MSDNEDEAPDDEVDLQTLILAFHGNSIQEALYKYATALRRTFWGYVTLFSLLAIFFGKMYLPPLPIPAAVSDAFDAALAMTMLGAVVYFYWKKWELYEFDIHFDGRWLLTVAFWCDMVAVLTKFGRNWLKQWPAVRLVEGTAALLGMVFLLLFLRALAGLIVRQDLRQRANWCLALGATCLFAFVFALVIPLGLVKLQIKAWPVLTTFTALAGLSGIALVAHVVAYAGLIWNLSTAMFGISKHLRDARYADDWDAIEEA